jgi:hypothetical protein
MNLKRILTSSLLMLSMSISSYSILLRPIGYDKIIDKDEGVAYGEFYLKNTSKEMARYKIEIESTGKDNDVSKHMTVYPNLIAVEPLSEKPFKVYIEDDYGDIKEGENSFILSIRTVNAPDIEDLKGKTKQTMSFQLGMKVEMFAYKGSYDKPLTVENSKFREVEGKKYWNSTVKNETGRGYELGIGFVDKANTLIDVKTKGRLFNGSKTEIEQEIPDGTDCIIFYDFNNYKVIGKQRIKVR